MWSGKRHWGMENSEPPPEGVPPPPHRCIFSTARQAPHKAADIVHRPLAEVLRGCGLLPIHEESPHGACVGGGRYYRDYGQLFARFPPLSADLCPDISEVGLTTKRGFFFFPWIPSLRPGWG